MKKSLLFMIAAVCCMAANAEAPERKMLEQGKMWVYTYHHFEMNETGYDESTWPAYYQLDGDITIDGQQYMKMYRWDERNWEKKYYGAFREDEEGRVYVRSNTFGEGDFKILDFSMDYGLDTPDLTIAETIKESGLFFRRYRYQYLLSDGRIYNQYIGVEGVGYQGKGLVLYILEPEDDCICDYEELAYVSAKDFWFNASAFNAPKEIELTDGERQLIASNNDFAFNLFRKARGEESNVLSPLSITYALGMLNNGAAGQTQQEINQTLGFGEAGADAINAFCQKMLKEAETLDEKTKSLIANTIFVNEGLGYRLQDDFTKKANDFYNAQPQNRDFYDGETMDIINQWASDHTEGMIPEVLDELSFNPSAVSYLLNAIYFKGMWSSPFDAADTKDEPFGGGDAVPMMHKTGTEYEYTENDLYQAVNLPYGNGAYRMSIFLPREGKTIGDVLDALNGYKWQVNGNHYEVDLKLPRFETDTNLDLVKIMSDLGMPTAFIPEVAEFPYFCNDPIYIGMMKQVAKIKLDEQGTEAAAVTIIEADKAMPDEATFHATRPFLYIISEQSTGAIFFIGQYMGQVATVTPADGKVTVGDVSDTGCLDKTTRSESVVGRPTLKLTRFENGLYGEWNNIAVNCAYGNISVACEEIGQNLSINLLDDSTDDGELATCICHINVYFTVYNALQEEYHLTLAGRDIGTVSFKEHSVVEIDLETLEQAYEEGFDYPVKIGYIGSPYEITDNIKPDTDLSQSLDIYNLGDQCMHCTYKNYVLPCEYTSLDVQAQLDQDGALVINILTDGIPGQGCKRVAHLSFDVINVVKDSYLLRLNHTIRFKDENGQERTCTVCLYEGEYINTDEDISIPITDDNDYRALLYHSDSNADLNGDGKVNGTDIQAVINVIVDEEYSEKADVNKDNKVNGTDIQEIINIIVNE